MNTLEAIKAVRKLITDPKHWTQGAFARDANGNSTDTCGPNATCWCIAGAITKVDIDAKGINGDIYGELAKSTEGDGIVYVNDNLGHKAILNVINKTITRLEKENVYGI